MSDTNLELRGSTWYARMSPPASLQRALKERGKSRRHDQKKSLSTGNKLEARKKLPAALVLMREQFRAEERALRQGASGVLHEPSEHELQQAAFQLIQAELQQDFRERASRPTSTEIEAMVEAHMLDLRRNPPASPLEKLSREASVLARAKPLRGQFRGVLREELAGALKTNDFHLIDWAIQDAAERNQWLIPEGSQAYKLFGLQLMQAWSRALKGQDLRDEGLYEEPAQVISLHAVTPLAALQASSEAAGKPKKGETLAEYFETYLKEVHPKLARAGLVDRRATLRQFVETAGVKHVSSYQKDDMAKFKRMLSKTPVGATKRYGRQTLPKIVQANETDQNPLLSQASIRNKLSTLSAFGKWLEGNVDGVRATNFQTTLPKKTGSERMHSFNPDEVRKILNATAFTGCLSERNQTETGTHRIRDYRFWVPLVAAFTGARLNEITQLKADDLKQHAGIWAFHITEEGEDQSLKNKYSERIVPVHPRLIELGLLDLHQATQNAGHADLFHEISLDADGRRSTRAGKTFTKFLRRIGVKKPGDLGGAHRWRHTLTDAMRGAGLNDGQIGQVLGHQNDLAKMTAHYGDTTTHLTLDKKHDLLARVDYPTVDFKLLQP